MPNSHCFPSSNLIKLFILTFILKIFLVQRVKNTHYLLLLGGGVVTTRAHVHYIVTEYGIAYLFGKNIRQRAHELIRIAHPDHREALEAAAFERLKCMPSPD